MGESGEILEIIWDGLLSRDTEKIQSAFSSLDDESRRNVIAHLHRMATEDGWHPGQVESARTALEVLEGEQEQDGY